MIVVALVVVLETGFVDVVDEAVAVVVMVALVVLLEADLVDVIVDVVVGVVIEVADVVVVVVTSGTI